MARYAEVVGADFTNKGAELMLRAAAARLTAPGSTITPAVRLRPRHYREQRRLGFHQKLALPRANAVSRAAGGLVKAALRSPMGLVTEAQIMAVLDASGFSYSDQWGMSSVGYLARRAERLARRGAKLVLLPQALGPFRSREGKEAFRRCLETGALVFARDDQSMEHAAATGGPTERLLQAPDFTCLLHPAPAATSSANPPYACVVPNMRMIDKAGGTGSRYVEAMCAATIAIRESGIDPVLLPFDVPGDVPLTHQIASLAGGVTVVTEPNALSLKGIIAGARLVVGSRYHALVSALCQAVPAVGTSWSHKYGAVFDDYGCPELLVPDLTDTSAVSDRVRRALEWNADGALSAQLADRAAGQRHLTEAMWCTVINHLEAPVPPALDRGSQPF